MGQKLGQHFLKNQKVISKILKTLEIENGGVVIEIGPGHGELTIPLAEACTKVDAKFIAIEKDAELAKNLKRRLTAAHLNAEVITGDVRSILPIHIAEIKKNTPYSVIGNLPYYLTGYLLRLIGKFEPKPRQCIFMLQKEVGGRIVSTPPHMNRLAAILQFWATTKIIAQVHRSDFSPPPKVDSVLLALIPQRDGVLPFRTYERVVSLAFRQPRKTLLNNLGAGLSISKDEIISIFSDLKLAPKVRPGELTITDIKNLAQYLGEALLTLPTD